MAAELVQYAEAVGNFLDTMAQFSDFEKLRAIEVQRLVEKLNGKSMSFADASRVADALKKLPLTSSQKDSLLTLLATSVQSNPAPAPSSATVRRGMQDFTNFSNMMDDATWSVVQNCSLTEAQRLDCLCTYLAVKLGLRCGSEPTMAAVTALILLSVDHESMTPVQKMSSYKRMSSRCKAICESQGPLRRTWIDKLPSSPELLPSDYQDVAAQVVACRVHQAQLNVLTSSIPCRSTHKSVRSDALGLSPTCTPGVPAALGGNVVANMMMQMMMQMFQRREHDDSGDAMPPGFTLLKPRGHSRQLDASARSLASGGLSPDTDSHAARAAGPAILSDPTALTRALARDPAGVLTATAPRDPAAAAAAAPTARTAALVPAAPAPLVLAAPTATPTAALVPAAPTAVPLPAAATAALVPAAPAPAPAAPAGNDIFATTALLRQKRAQVQKKPAAKAPKKARRAGPSDADPSQAAPSDADPSQAAPSDADPNPNQAGSSTDQNPDGPGQAGSSGNPRLVLPFSPEEAKIKAPNGCSKCRYKPGCTPSCWRSRGFRSWA